MLVNLEFAFTLTEPTDRHKAKVQIWVDANGDQVMDAEEEVTPLVRSGRGWRGSYALEVASVDRVGFLVRYTGAVGSQWALTVWCDQPKRHEVYREKDTVRADQGRIIGWCRG